MWIRIGTGFIRFWRLQSLRTLGALVQVSSTAFLLRAPCDLRLLAGADYLSDSQLNTNYWKSSKYWLLIMSDFSYGSQLSRLFQLTAGTELI
jgi:hypothetical protein